MAHILDILKERGFIAQTVYEDELYKLLEKPTTFYVGFDPTADSLHIGHYIPIIAMAHMQRAGHHPIALMGNGTAMISDPSGKDSLRQTLSKEELDHNANAIKQQMSRFIDFSDNRASIMFNGDWLREAGFIDFMRDIGAHFSVNRMLTAECYRTRLEKGLTFLEFTYMLLQSYDFLELFRRKGCRLQIGGDDQWSNILSGADLIRRKEREDAFCFTLKLLLTSDGRKMGKTEAGALWLDPNRVSPFDFFQYWRNVDDADVQKCLSMLTFLPMEEVRRLSALKDAALNQAKEVLAFEVTKLIHGEAEAQKALDAARALFSGSGDMSNVPTAEVTRAQLAEDPRLTTLLVTVGLASSRGDARKLVAGGGVNVAGEQVADIDKTLSEADFPSEGLMVRKGKKTYCRVRLV